MPDTHPLERFLSAQKPSFDRALAEILAGRKTSHWMWYIFPQIRGLGTSETSRHYAIQSLDEARAYINHPILGTRYLQCVQALLRNSHLSAEQIFGPIDAVKLRSSLTLFLQVASEEQARPLQQALRTFFHDQPDPLTLQILQSTS